MVAWNQLPSEIRRIGPCLLFKNYLRKSIRLSENSLVMGGSMVSMEDP